MFQFNKKLKRLDIPAKDVLRLQRSLSDVQIALPGITAQLAKAYVCAFSTEHGLRVAIAFHLRDTNNVVYYLNDDGNISRKEIVNLLHEGVLFAETLGFILSDLGIHELEPKDRDELWDSLPLKKQPKAIVPVTTVEKKSVKKQTSSAIKTAIKGNEVVKVIEVDTDQNSSESEDDIDLGLLRASALISMRRKKVPPTAEELEEKRNKLRESLGRFLSSL
jgi:hypothetical protein